MATSGRKSRGSNLRPASADSRTRALLDKEASARYLSTSTKTVERLVQAGVLPVVKLPVERGKQGRGEVGINRRVCRCPPTWIGGHYRKP